ncbi:ABC transporter ATP-binding protein [Desulfobacula phenolica]|uniref:ABC-2 type transport system ATP-binding protein n=1 Tax=Desulfobacula phenolica TaxID=90732 RepID=A0A1H2JWQ5_9BACT|nr:ABC transporter ATP-binding protein [Desulfobacula phenolica]SDU60576.1 ABC-2 type transport system ATP-binding protein [Desulfobacula phenolica]
MEVVFDQVNKTFVSSFARKKVHAVVDLSLSVKTGEILGIVGPNGAGKSTLLKMLMGFIRHDSGTILIGDKRPSDPEARIQMGYLPENPYYYDHLSAEDLMKFSATTSGMVKQDIKPRIETLLKTLNLEHARKRRLRTYSKGMTQRAGICFALVHDPELIIFDEPMSGLDPLGRKLVVDMVLDLKKKGKTILFCSHILNDVERLCDRMAIMDKGHLKKILSKQELMEKLDDKPAAADGSETNILENIFLDTIESEVAYE